MSFGVVSPLPRVVGPESAEIGGAYIPKGVWMPYLLTLWRSCWYRSAQTTVSMTATFLHNDPEMFPSPSEFRPERWLQPNSRELENYLVTFSKGPRSCLGVKSDLQLQFWGTWLMQPSQFGLVWDVSHTGQYLSEARHGDTQYNVRLACTFTLRFFQTQFRYPVSTISNIRLIFCRLLLAGIFTP